MADEEKPQRKPDDKPVLEVKPKLSVDADKEAAEAKARELAEALASKMAAARSTARTIRLVVGGIGVALVLMIKLISFLMHNHGLGAVVTKADECRSGMMLTRGGGVFSVAGICTESCDDKGRCPDKYRCHGGSCVPDGNAAVGADCDAPWDCESYECLRVETSDEAAVIDGGLPAPRFQSYCSRACEPEGPPCPSGMVCDVVSDAFSCVKGTSISRMGLLKRELQDLGRRLGQDLDPPGAGLSSPAQ